MAQLIKFKRGLNANVAGLTLQAGEPAFVTDKGKLYVGDGTKNVLINPDLGTASGKDVGTNAGNIPELVAGGKLPESVLPAIAISDVFEVDSESKMLALVVETGDVAIRTDLSKSFILSAMPASVLANWKELRTPTDAVQSVAGKTGVVSLTKADVGLDKVTNESKATMFTSPALTGTPTAPTPSATTNNTQLATTAFVKLQGYLTADDFQSISIDGGSF